MSRPFALVTLALTAMMAFMIGLIVSGWTGSAIWHSSTPVSAQRRRLRGCAARHTQTRSSWAAYRADPTRHATRHRRRGRQRSRRPGEFRRRGRAHQPGRGQHRGDHARQRHERAPAPRAEPFDASPQGPSAVRPQSGSGFVIEGSGEILTNYHVIQSAERIMVKFADGRNLPARVLGIDPDTDIALIKVDATDLPVAPLGDSETLRVGEWVCAIGNPLAYEHTVTVGVVSYLGRKLFDSSLDNYIQTDAAINFGNSGGPLINGRGEVVGINSAISQRASNIGFAVPINEATAILPQLKSQGRVARGFMGVALTDVDPDLQRSLRLGSTQGALVQDVTAGSPGHRAGLARLRPDHRHRRQARRRTTTRSSARWLDAVLARLRDCTCCATAAPRR